MTVLFTDTAETYCEVYWIRRSSHTDIFSEGYVGISVKGAEKRFIEHKSATKSGSTLTVHNAMRKYSDIVVETMLIGSLDYCLEVELKLRPTPRIGWNLASGGEKTMLGFRHTEESKKKISENNGSRGRVYSEEDKLYRSEAAKQLKHSEETKTYLRSCALDRIAKDGGQQLKAASLAATERNKILRPWQRPNTDINIWLLADEIYQATIDNPDFGQRKIARLLGTTPSKIYCVFRDIRSGWVPNKDPEWVNFKLKVK